MDGERMKIKADGVIRGRVYYNEFGQFERREFWWEEGEIARISDELMAEWKGTVEVGEVLHMGGLRLKVIKRERCPLFCYYVMRDGWRAWLYYWLVRGVELAGFDKQLIVDSEK